LYNQLPGLNAAAMKFCFNSSFYFVKNPVIYITAFFSLCVLQATAQGKYFAPAIEDQETLKSISSLLEKRYKQDIDRLPAVNKSDLTTIYKQRWDKVRDVVDNDEIYTDKQAQEYLDKIVAEIVKANPLLQNKEFSCYFSRSGIPNAAYLGEGLILFNMGLFSRLSNESQAAFILCHELGHFYLEHSENSIKSYVERMNSSEVQGQLKNIKRSEYGKRAELEKLLKGLTFDTRRHGRDHESSADSMAIEFLRNTRFDLSESLSTLALLDSIDNNVLQTGEALQRLFNAKEYPFQKRWISKEEGLLGGHAQLKQDESIADSLKTHPDCKLRIMVLEPMVEKYASASSIKNSISESKFNELKNTFRYEVVEYAFISDDYTKSLQYTIELLQDHPSDPYLVTQTGKIFNGFYAAQKNHTLGKVSTLPAPYFEPNYNLLLQFIQNLFIEDYAAISYNFLKQYSPQMEKYSEFKKTYNTSIELSKQ
jgi:Zn-dependent protease with chaperone function